MVLVTLWRLRNTVFFEPFDTHDARAATQPWRRSKMSPVPERFDRMNALLIIALAELFPVVHIANGWLFKFAEITPHISLIYLPAFLRLANVLVLGPRNGTLATLLGGVLLGHWGVAAFPWVLAALLLGSLTIALQARTHGFPSGDRRSSGVVVGH